MEDRRGLLRKTPKIDEVLQDERLLSFTESTPKAVIVESVREVAQELKKDVLEGRRSQVGTKETLVTEIVARITSKKEKNLRRIINTTGVVLRTNLGRANLSDKTCKSIMDVTRNYTNLEYDMKRGSRGSRHDHVEKILTKVTGAKAAMVVNNNAAATMLCLSALAKDKGAIVSRGELMKISGPFRVPGIMEQNGVKLMDVGITNKTRLLDYLNAYREGETGVLMKVHTSNYRILGFAQGMELPEVVELGKKLNFPVIYDMGSGLTTDLADYEVDKPTILSASRTSIDVILFGGDRLLDRSQSGIIAGKKEPTGRMKAHPLARAPRVDRMVLAVAEATLFEYSGIRRARRTVPVLNMVTAPTGELKYRAERLTGDIHNTVHNFIVEVGTCKDQVGGGSAPTVLLDGHVVVVQGKTLASGKIERLLRKGEVPIVVRITHNQVYLDVRIIREDEFGYIVAAFTVMGNRQVEG